MGIEVRAVTAEEFPSLVPDLVDLFIATVGEGASLGFIPPVASTAALKYWMTVGPELQAGSRVLIGAFRDGRIAGCSWIGRSEGVAWVRRSCPRFTGARGSVAAPSCCSTLVAR